uniref:Uncharacterized protein n=1 Tax=Arundo donax TaxID=35708 RepID=A0A0A8XYK5_ARUDO
MLRVCLVQSQGGIGWTHP